MSGRRREGALALIPESLRFPQPVANEVGYPVSLLRGIYFVNMACSMSSDVLPFQKNLAFELRKRFQVHRVFLYPMALFSIKFMMFLSLKLSMMCAML